MGCRKLSYYQTAVFSTNDAIPKAYINYLFFDKDRQYKSGGFDQVSTAALNSFEELSLSFTPDEEGYMIIYVANQTDEDLNVYMDDMTIEHIEGPIIQTDDYYPFGLTFNSSERSGFLTNSFLYNGKELQEDLGLDTYDFHARMYDPVLGRTFQIDPHLENYYDWSPYSWAGDNPIIMIDPTGMDWYRNQENRGLEWIDVTPGEDETDQSYKVQEGYDYLAGADASIDQIREVYAFMDSEASASLLDAVTVEPSISDKAQDLGQKGLELGLNAARNSANSFSFVGTGVVSPIINAIGGGDVSWAKVYTFDENWSWKGKELDNGTLNNEELRETVHSTVGVFLSVVPSVKVLNTASPIIKNGGNALINNQGKSLIQKSIDKAIGYK